MESLEHSWSDITILCAVSQVMEFPQSPHFSGPVPEQEPTNQV